MINWFVRHPTAANLLMLAIAALGLSALPGLQRETFPQIENDRVQVQVRYPGATPGEIEDAICRRLEEAIEGVSGLNELLCESVEGRGTATARMREGADKSRFLADIKSDVDAIDTFPDDAEAPVVTEPGRKDAVISVAVSGPRDPVALKAYAEQLKARMLRLDDIAEVTLEGFSEHHLRIEVSGARLRQFGLSAADLAAVIERHSVGVPGGRLEGGDEDVLIRINDQRKSVAALRDLVVVSGASGANVRLGDLATVVDQFDRDDTKILFNGVRAALLKVTKTSDQDILSANNAVREFVEREVSMAPRGVHLTLTQDVSSVVQDRLDMLLENGAQGLFLVFVVLWLFFSLRYSFWVTMGLPISFLGGLFLLPAFGITINMISMVGLLIGIGLLMDDAIVIAENVAARLNKGDTPVHAAAEGVRQVFPGIMSSFATTLMVFGSLAFISGDIGQILRVMPVVLIVVLSVSLLEAFLILPNHLAHSLSHMEARPPSSFRQAFERHFDELRDRYFGVALDAAIEHRYLTVGLGIMLLAAAIAVPAGGGLKFVSFPELDGDVVEARLLLPQGTPIARTEALVEKLSTALESVNERYRSDQPNGVDLVRNVTVMFGRNPDAYETGPHVASVIADLLGTQSRTTTVDEITSAWRAAVGRQPDVLALKFTKPAVGPGGRAIDVRFLGDDLNELKAAAGEFQRWLNQFGGVNDVGDDLRPGKRELGVTMKPGAGALG
ncbi:MAG: efflux RND transporter permease subunit, partial [Chromatiales bacterium]|nr:efflux RND transporter permease subunit [Chromatiales bacterium]